MPLPRTWPRAASALLALCASLLLAACATTSPDTSSPATAGDGAHAALKARAAQRWQYIIDHQPAKAWDYLTPGYRATITRAAYAAKWASTPMRYLSVKVTKASCVRPENCRVYIKLGYALPAPGAGGELIQAVAPIKETWLQLDGNWYYLPDADG